MNFICLTSYMIHFSEDHSKFWRDFFALLHRCWSENCGISGISNNVSLSKIYQRDGTNCLHPCPKASFDFELRHPSSTEKRTIWISKLSIRTKSQRVLCILSVCNSNQHTEKKFFKSQMKLLENSKNKFKTLRKMSFNCLKCQFPVCNSLKNKKYYQEPCKFDVFSVLLR